MTHVTQQQEPLQLETVGGDLIVDTVGGLIRRGVVCRGGLFILQLRTGRILLCKVL